MIVSVHQPQYLPWLGYFHKIAHSDAFIVLDMVQYKHREFQNRNKIRTDKGWLWLTVPVSVKQKRSQTVREVRIDDQFPWRHDHWEGLKSCYSGAPWFAAHRAFFEQVYAREWSLLIDCNVHIVRYLLEQFGITVPLYFESEIGSSSTGTGRIIELCKKLGADTYLSGAGGRAYLEEEKFREAEISLTYQQFTHPVYRQQYGGAFVPYMSSVDLLFNEGPHAREALGR